MKKEHHLWELFITFFKIGALTFGGGLAMMPIMHKEVVDKKHWIDDEDVIKILVISQSTPGVFAINSATFIGYKIAKFPGALLATLGVILPSFIIISIISLFLLQFRELTVVSYAFIGIQVGVSILIFKAALKISSNISFNILAVFILIGAFAVSLLTNFNVIYIILIAAAIGILIGVVKTMKVGARHDS